MSWLTAKIGGFIAAAIGSLLAIFMFWTKAKNAGRKEVKDAVNIKAKDKVIEIMKEDKKIEEDTSYMSDDDILAELLNDASDADHK